MLEKFKTKRRQIVAVGVAALAVVAYAYTRTDKEADTAPPNSTPSNRPNLHLPKKGAPVYDHPGDHEPCGQITGDFPYGAVEAADHHGAIFYRYSRELGRFVQGECEQLWLPAGSTIPTPRN